MTDPIWITTRQAIEIHKDVVSASGGSHGVRDESLLDSAMMRPLNVLAYETDDLFELAASYAEAIIRNHPFIDGNKRTALIIAHTFLAINGFMLQTRPKLSDLMVGLAERKISHVKVAVFFEKHSDKTQE